MSKTYEAGTLILNQLKTFNEGIFYFEQVLTPVVDSAIDSCVETFCENSDEDWEGDFDFAANDNCWLAPERWNINPDGEKPNFKASFDIECIHGDDDYWTALFCGVGVTGGEAGFMFYCQVSEFGGKVAWRNHIRNQGKLVDAIEALGFKKQNDGNFFLPIRLNASELAKTWDDSGGELKGDDDCFQSVRNALDTIDKSVPLFDALMESCQGQKTPKKKL